MSVAKIDRGVLAICVFLSYSTTFAFNFFFHFRKESVLTLELCYNKTHSILLLNANTRIPEIRAFNTIEQRLKSGHKVNCSTARFVGFHLEG